MIESPKPMEVPASATSWVEVDRQALARNVRTFCHRLGPDTGLVAVVKANAYGHGVSIVAPDALAAGARALAVVSLDEGLELRACVGGTARILLLGHVPPGGAEEVAAAGLEPVVYDAACLDALSRASAERPVAVHLKVETGTHRQGVPESELLELARHVAASPGLELAGVSTHFADIEDTTDHSFASGQIERFRQAWSALAEAGLPAASRHSACSAAAILFPETHLDLARVGIALYGLWPSRETRISARERGMNELELAPVMSWRARVAQVKEVPAGSYVGYGRTWRATRDSRIAVLPVGYYEGYARALGDSAHVLVREKRARVVGRICMNMTMVDVTDIPGVTAGDVATLLGDDGPESIRAEDLASWAGTIHYEIVSRIHPALPRVAG